MLDISVDVDDTRSVVPGTTLDVEGRSYGIIACEHEDTPLLYPAYDWSTTDMYSNIKAWYGRYNGSRYGTWWYSFEATESALFQPLFFVTEDTSRHMDIYAYAPWKSDVSIKKGYRYYLFTSEDYLEDVMYATYDDVSGNPTNRDITITDGDSVKVNVKFHHVLSSLAFYMKLATAQNTGLDGTHSISLSKISIIRNEGCTTPLYTSGTMNIVNGTLIPGTASEIGSEQGVTYRDAVISRDDEWKAYNMLLHPVQYRADGDFILRFYFNGEDADRKFIMEYPITISDLNHHDDAISPTIGFQPGYCYHFYFIIDNYIHLQNVIVNQEWTTTEEQELKI